MVLLRLSRELVIVTRCFAVYMRKKNKKHDVSGKTSIYMYYPRAQSVSIHVLVSEKNYLAQINIHFFVMNIDPRCIMCHKFV
jgi:hypothetical protein